MASVGQSNVVLGPTEVRIGENKDIPAMLFQSTDALLGETREVWFLCYGYLFEVTSPLVHDDWLTEVLSTLVFSSDL